MLAPPPAPFHPFRVLPGRLLILSGVSVVLVWLLGQVTTVPPVVEAFRKVASLALRVSVVWLAVVVLVRYRHQFLWRVRRKLILSYVFLGFVPVALVIAFASVAAVIVHGATASYLFDDGLQDIKQEALQMATTAATNIGLDLVKSQVVILGQRNSHLKSDLLLRSLSLAVVPVAGGTGPIATAGDWAHLAAPPAGVPEWTRDQASVTLLAVVSNGPADSQGRLLLVRATAPLPGGRHAVVVDLPLDFDAAARMDEIIGVRLRGFEISQQAAGQEVTAQPFIGVTSAMTDGDDAGAAVAGFTVLRRTVMFADFTDSVVAVCR